MEDEITKAYIWSLPTRLFHILLVLSVLAVFILDDNDDLLVYHVIFGYFIALLFIFRILWGFMDVKYSNFKDFNFKIKDLIFYMQNVFNKKEKYKGHNPASSWAIVLMIAFGLLSVISGIFVYGTQEGLGILSFLNIPIFKDMKLFKNIHELFANTFMFIIFAHIAGVLLDKFLHNTDNIDSMVSGYKISDEGNNLKLTILQKIFGSLWIGLSLFLLLYLLYTPKSILLANGDNQIEYKVKK